MNDYNYYLKKYGEYAEVSEIKYPIVKAVGLPGAKIKEIVMFETGEIEVSCLKQDRSLPTIDPP